MTKILPGLILCLTIASLSCFSQDTEQHPAWLLQKINKDLILLDKLKKDIELYRISNESLDSANAYILKALGECENISKYHSGLAQHNETIMFEYQKKAAEFQKMYRKLKRQRTWERIGEVAIVVAVIIAL